MRIYEDLLSAATVVVVPDVALPRAEVEDEEGVLYFSACVLRPPDLNADLLTLAILYDALKNVTKKSCEEI